MLRKGLVPWSRVTIAAASSGKCFIPLTVSVAFGIMSLFVKVARIHSGNYFNELALQISDQLVKAQFYIISNKKGCRVGGKIKR